MAIYAQILYHVIFTTKHRERTLAKSKRPELYSFLWEQLKTKQCRLHRVGGVEDHVHLLISLHPSVALGPLIAELKTNSEAWVRAKFVFKPFSGWQQGYAAFTHALVERNRLMESIAEQEKLHAGLTFREEFEQLLAEAGMEIATNDEEWFDDDQEPWPDEIKTPAHDPDGWITSTLSEDFQKTY